METGRRNFLKIGGICALGLGSLKVLDAFAKTAGAQIHGKSPGAHRQKMGHGDRYEEVLGKRGTRLQGLRSGLPRDS